MFCTSCGSKIPDESLFCPACGARVATEEPAAPVQEPQTPAAEQEFVPPAAPVYEPQQPVYTAPVYEPQQPVYTQPAVQPIQQAPRAVPKVFSILSKVLTLLSFITGIFVFIAYIALLSMGSYGGIGARSQGVSLLFGSLSLITTGVVGLVFSIKAKRAAMIVLSVIGLVINFIGLIMVIVLLGR